jgi:hypothetical protein
MTFLEAIADFGFAEAILYHTRGTHAFAVAAPIA